MSNRNGQREVDRIFKAQLGILPDAGFGVFVGADPGHAERMRLAAETVVSQLKLRKKERPQMWFTSIDRFFYMDFVRDANGKPKVDRHGYERKREYLIKPKDFFTKDIFVNLDGKPGRLVL